MSHEYHVCQFRHPVPSLFTVLHKDTLRPHTTYRGPDSVITSMHQVLGALLFFFRSINSMHSSASVARNPTNAIAASYRDSLRICRHTPGVSSIGQSQ